MMDETINSQVEAVLSEDNEDDGYEGQRQQGGKRVFLKMLVPENIAGAVIGKAGATIAELQEESGARIKVSQASDFYPGSSDRTIVLSGFLENVIKGQVLIWQKISEVSVCFISFISLKPEMHCVQFRKPRFNEEFPSSSTMGKLSIPNECGGLIIGKAGATIRTIQQESSARVQIASKENNESRITRERVISISGPVQACVRATEMIVIKMAEDPSASYQNKTTSYGVMGMGGGRMMNSSRIALPSGAETVSATSTITMKVPDTMVGHILGKRGATMREIQQMSGANVVLSNR
jgi:polyribonucleotide nucleotidyltransferase